MNFIQNFNSWSLLLELMSIVYIERVEVMLDYFI